MKRVYGWDHREEYGWFMTAALATLSLALVALMTVHALVARYEWKLSAGDFAPAAMQTAEAGVTILGATIGDVPDDASLASLRSELDARINGLPWDRALIRQQRGSAHLAIQSYFFPFNAP
ncbi:MAG: hypothetical protein JO348_06330, partial [Alphaproteobacteria bacterium]|nr:hypothetical protein [Alphaproteobacteria bacterium]